LSGPAKPNRWTARRCGSCVRPDGTWPNTGPSENSTP
jgi:hypothetical protein